MYHLKGVHSSLKFVSRCLWTFLQWSGNIDTLQDIWNLKWDEFVQGIMRELNLWNIVQYCITAGRAFVVAKEVLVTETVIFWNCEIDYMMKNS